MIQAANNINNNNNNRNNNNNDVNNNNNNVNVANLASMQMNMNMVMVGRQLEHLKKDKERLKARLQNVKAMEEKVDSTTLSPAASGDDWMISVKQELSNMLGDIPATGKKKRPTTEAGSLWDFWHALDGVLLSRTKRDTTTDPFCATTDAVYFGLTFVDFWMKTSTSMIVSQSENELAAQFCELGSENRDFIRKSPTLEKIDDVLSLGAAVYMQQQMASSYNSSYLLEAAHFGRNNGRCESFGT